MSPSLSLTILGSGGISPDPQRKGPSFLVSSGDSHILVDVGPGCLRNLVLSGHDPSEMLGACITHRHPDHTSEFRLFLDLERSKNRANPLWLAGTCIVDEMVHFHLNLGRQIPAKVPFPIERLQMPGRGEIGPFEVSGAPVPHVEHSVGYRISAGGRTLVYTGDCGPGKEVVSLCQKADLLLIEATLPVGARSQAHLSPEEASEIAIEAGCKRLVLTHFSPHADVDTAISVCQKKGLDVSAAKDLDSYTV